ncbi:MAG: RAMP superfamily CRISPR-associated protein [Oscillospiraceae bacterium]|jgi:CRISPR/Cas system CSM-associated protein Csm3 (group 7 of RAMP superfamily)|nr:RAMP superfamily CRISPR-associated protein [Oscillospiraceae bacterium]
MKRIDCNIRVTIDGAFHTGGGKGARAQYCYAQKDADGGPYWPGSALKGKVRAVARQFSALQGNACQFTHTGEDKRTDCTCDVCQMMGGAGNARGSLYFSDLKPEKRDATVWQMRSGNQINRHCRVVEDEKLYSMETASAAEGLVLEGHITGFLSEERYEEQKALLEASLRHITVVGGSTSRGLGWVSDVEIQWQDGETSTPNAPEDDEASEDAEWVETWEDEVPEDGPRVRIRLTPQSPVQIGRYSTQTNYRDTQYLIPGSVFRAFMAGEIVSRSGVKSGGRLNFVKPPLPDETNPLFGGLRRSFERIRISALTPLGARPLPLSAQVCKYGDCPSKHPKVVVDTLARLLSEDRSEEGRRCPACGERLERAEGLYIKRQEGLYLVEPETVTATKSAMDRYRGTTQDEMLYTLRMMSHRVRLRPLHITEETAEKHENLCEDLYFAGAISGPVPQNELRPLLKNGARVGSNLTSGYGHMSAKVKFEQAPDPQSVCVYKKRLQERIEAFNQVVRDWGGKEPSGIYIPITLLTDAPIEGEMLSEMLAVESEENPSRYEVLLRTRLNGMQGTRDCWGTAGLRLHTALAQTIWWRGFDTSQRERYLKTAVQIIRAGAVFVLAAETLSEDLLDALLVLQRRGLCLCGEEESERPSKPKNLYAENGYGAVCVADAFYSEYALKKSQSTGRNGTCRR